MDRSSFASVGLALLYATLCVAYALIESWLQWRVLAGVLATLCALAALVLGVRVAVRTRRYRRAQFYAMFKLPFGVVVRDEPLRTVFDAYSTILSLRPSMEPYVAFVLEGERAPIDCVVVSASGIHAFRLTDTVDVSVFTRLCDTLSVRLLRPVKAVNLCGVVPIQPTLKRHLTARTPKSAHDEITTLIKHLDRLGDERIETLDSRRRIA